jgi:hypothetical protein
LTGERGTPPSYTKTVRIPGALYERIEGFCEENGVKTFTAFALYAMESTLERHEA